MVFEKKQLSKALAIALMVACAVAFMPLLNGQAFAAAKKPKKAKITSFVQSDTMTTEGYTVTGKWKAAKNAKKYKVIIKEDGTAVLTKTVSKKTKSISYAKAQPGKKYTLSVQSLNGKKKAKAATKNLTVVDKRVALESVAINLNKVGATMIVPGDTLTAAVQPAEATVTYKWMRVKGTSTPEEIAGATSASYTVAKADIGYNLAVVASAPEADLKYVGSVSAMTDVAVSEAPKGDFYAGAEVAIVGQNATVAQNPASTATGATYAWYENGQLVKKGSSNTYAPKTAGSTLKCTVTYTDNGKEKTLDVDFGTVAKNIKTDYPTLKTDKVPAVGVTVTAGLYKSDGTTKYAGSSDVTYSWTYTPAKAEAPVVKTGETFTFEGDALGVPVALSAVVTPGEDNYAGEYAAAPWTINDTIDAITISGDAVVGGTLNAKVTGKTGADMTKTATIQWQYSLDNGGTYSDGLAPANKTWENIPYDLYGQMVRARVTATTSPATYLYSTPVKIEKMTVNSIELKYARNIGTADEPVYEALTFGRPASVTFDGVLLSDSQAKFAVQDVKFFKNVDKANVYTGTGASTLTPQTTDGDAWYGVEITLVSGADFVEFATLRSEPVQAAAPKSTLTVAIAKKNADGTTTSDGVAARYGDGDTLVATSSATPGKAVDYQWYLGNEKNPIEGANTAEYTVKESDAGKTLYVKATCDGYYPSNLTQVLGTIQKTAHISVEWSEVVGGTSTMTGAPEGATVRFGHVDVNTIRSDGTVNVPGNQAGDPVTVGTEPVTQVSNHYDYDATNESFIQIAMVQLPAGYKALDTGYTATYQGTTYPCFVAPSTLKAGAASVTIAADYATITGNQAASATISPENYAWGMGQYEVTDGAATYQWYRVEAGGDIEDAVAISGATSASYAPGSVDANKGYDVFVKLTNVRPAYAANAEETTHYIVSNVAKYDGDGGWTIQ